MFDCVDCESLNLVETFHKQNIKKHFTQMYIALTCTVTWLTESVNLEVLIMNADSYNPNVLFVFVLVGYRHRCDLFCLSKRTHFMLVNKRPAIFWSGISQSTRCNSTWEFVCCCCLRCCFFCCWYRLRRRRCGVATSLWKPLMQNPGPICIHPHLVVLEDVVGRRINTAAMVESCRKSTVRRDGAAVVFNTVV